MANYSGLVSYVNTRECSSTIFVDVAYEYAKMSLSEPLFYLSDKKKNTFTR